jgi:CheY-like chemotaxis protein
MQKPLQVFLIDDDEDEHFIFERALNDIDKHIDYYHAYSGEDALRMLATTGHLPDYIFLDLNMPRMDGKQCLWEIKNLYNLAVIIYTTSCSQKDMDDAKALGAEWFLVKPNSIALLKKSIELILYNPLVPQSTFAVETGVSKL